MTGVGPKYPLAWRLRADFAGNRPPRQYLSPDIRRKNPGWGDEVFNRTIERLRLYLPTGHIIILSGMRQYNFFIEAAQGLGGGRASIQAFYLCGHYPGRAAVALWRVAPGKVFHHLVAYGAEYNGQATRGWKPGAPGRPVSVITRG